MEDKVEKRNTKEQNVKSDWSADVQGQGMSPRYGHIGRW